MMQKHSDIDAEALVMRGDDISGFLKWFFYFYYFKENKLIFSDPDNPNLTAIVFEMHPWTDFLIDWISTKP